MHRIGTASQRVSSRAIDPVNRENLRKANRESVHKFSFPLPKHCQALPSQFHEAIRAEATLPISIDFWGLITNVDVVEHVFNTPKQSRCLSK
jgi:hypothetical protein